MHEILRNLPEGARVLDLGSGAAGSFGAEHCPHAIIIRLDPQRPPTATAGFVQANAAHLPFRDASFDAVIANHSLEHMEQLGSALSEVGRVVRCGASLYVAVPDSSTFSDKLYRWIYHGGGHINPFDSPAELSRRISQPTGLRPVAVKVLYASFIYLHHSHFHPRPPRRLWLFGNGNARFIATLSYALRGLDRLLGTRASVYGWGLYFGAPPPEIDMRGWTNVCVHCGAGHPAAWLQLKHAVHRRILWMRAFDCPNCGGWNLFTNDIPEVQALYTMLQ
jgi:SAM-dependent methyltransferase